MPIITPADLGTYMARTITAGAHEDAVAEMIDGLEGDLAAYLKRPVVPTDFTDEAVEVTRSGQVYLKRSPVISVASFTVDGVALDATWYTVKDYGLHDVWPGFLPSPLIQPAPTLLVSYRAGLPGDDPTTDFGRKARGVLLRAAVRDFNQVVREDLAGVARGSVEGTSLEFHGGVKAGAGGLTESELESFKRWKRRTVRT